MKRRKLRTCGVTELRAKFEHIVDAVADKNVGVIIARRGRSIARMIAVRRRLGTPTK